MKIRIPKFNDCYQTVIAPDGIVLCQGLFPTDKWFNALCDHISFKDKSFLDLGCCMFGFGLLALQEKVRCVWGIESDPKRINQCCDIFEYLESLDNQYTDGIGYRDQVHLIHTEVEEFDFAKYPHDIILCSMLMHWLKDPKAIIGKMAQSCNEHLVFIYRAPNPGLQEPGFRPTPEELDQVVGLHRLVNLSLSDTQEQNIRLAIYGKNI